MTMTTDSKFEADLRTLLDAEDIRGLAEHGAEGGWQGLTYYRETCALYQKHKEEIWEMLFEDAEDFGMTWPAMLDSFAGSKHVATVHGFENLLVWYAAERTARRIVDAEEAA